VELLGPFVPQDIYQKHSTMEEKLGEVIFKHRDPIEFKSTDGSKGIALKEVHRTLAEHNLTLKLEDAGKTIFDDEDENVKDTVSLRLEVSLVFFFFCSWSWLISFDVISGLGTKDGLDSFH
jgi:hypothetical protein